MGSSSEFNVEAAEKNFDGDELEQPCRPRLRPDELSRFRSAV